MSNRLLQIFSLICLMLLMAASSASAQSLRPEDTFFIKPRIGISSYLGDNEKSPGNLNFDMYKIDGKLPFNLALELGYQFSVPFSLSAAYQLGNYPIITQFGEEEGNERGIDDDPTVRHSIEFFGRYTFANDRSRVAPYLDFRLAYSFGDVRQQDGTQASGSAFGPLLGLGLDIAVNDRTSFFIESVSGIHLTGDTELDGNEDNGFGGTDVLTGIGLGLKINFKRAFTAVQVFSLSCPDQLTVGQTGTFTAVTNDADATQPVEYRWDYGDGQTGGGMSASHAYSQSGSYTVTFTATNSGSTASLTCTVQVIQPAEIVTITADRTSVDTCEDTQAVNFRANVRGDTPLTYNWDFGDGTTSNQANPSHKYTTEGTYTVRLTVTNSGGSDTRTLTVNVTPCENACDDIADLNSVFFDRNSSVLTDQARQALQENIQVLRDCSNVNVRIEGYASRDERNPQRLSEDRARAVEQFYIDNGIAAGRLTTVGLGAQGQTTKKGAAAQFRRVDSIPVQQ